MVRERGCAGEEPGGTSGGIFLSRVRLSPLGQGTAECGEGPFWVKVVEDGGMGPEAAVWGAPAGAALSARKQAREDEGAE